MARGVDRQRLLEQMKDLVSPEVFAQVSSQIGGVRENVAADNQNQNQGGAQEFARLKPEVLRDIVFPTRGAQEVMDNQNQNQGSTPAVEEQGKPGSA